MEKMQVEIISEAGAMRKRYPFEGNRIIIQKWDKNKHGGYMPTFTPSSVKLYKSGIWPFRSLKRRVYLMKDASACIDFTFLDEQDKAIMPTVTRGDIAKVFKMEVFRAAGTITNKLQVPTMLYILSIIPTMFCLIILLVITGRLRI